MSRSIGVTCFAVYFVMCVWVCIVRLVELFGVCLCVLVCFVAIQRSGRPRKSLWLMVFLPGSSKTDQVGTNAGRHMHTLITVALQHTHTQTHMHTQTNILKI